MECSYSSDEEYEVCERTRPTGISLPFDAASLEDIILRITDKFNFRILMDDNRFKSAAVVTAGLGIAGGLIGRHFGGRTGALIGGAIGGACGVGVIVVSMREIWQDIKEKLWELFDIVYDYLAGMGINDYVKAAQFIVSGGSSELPRLILETTSKLLGKQVLSSLTNI